MGSFGPWGSGPRACSTTRPKPHTVRVFPFPCWGEFASASLARRLQSWMVAIATPVPERSAQRFPWQVCREREPEDAPGLRFKSAEEPLRRLARRFPLICSVGRSSEPDVVSTVVGAEVVVDGAEDIFVFVDSPQLGGASLGLDPGECQLDRGFVPNGWHPVRNRPTTFSPNRANGYHPLRPGRCQPRRDAPSARGDCPLARPISPARGLPDPCTGTGNWGRALPETQHQSG